MSDLTATNCGGGCGCGLDNNNGCCGSSMWIIILLLLFGGNNGCGNSLFGCGCGNDNNTWLVILILLICCGGLNN